MGLEGSQEATREAAILKALAGIAGAKKAYGSRQINACAPGFHVFSKFVKLPPVDTSKVTQIIRYEAQQNVPFPLDEVVWDYQILGTSATNELEVLLVAVKSEIVEGLFRVAEGAGLRMKLVDVSPAALCNAFRYNYGDLEGCTMLLDIGAKTSNLLFFEKGKVYSRSINIGANSITQDFANEAKMQVSRSRGGSRSKKGRSAWAAPTRSRRTRRPRPLPKIARQVMTRLHIQVNQTIQFFRGQQGGSAPQRLFLSGGASIMPYTAQFFAEKLNLPVDYFNPFRNIEIDPALDLEELSKYAHSFGEVVGLGLRDLAHCPVELNLMPKSSLQRQEFGHKKPYLVASVFCVALVVFASYKVEMRIGDVWRDRDADMQTPLAKLTAADQSMNKALGARSQLQKQADEMKVLGDNRFFWIKILTDLREVMMQAEAAEKARLTTPDNGGTNTDEGIWVDTFTPIVPDSFSAGTQATSTSGGFGGRMRFDGRRQRFFGNSASPTPQAPPTPTPGATASTSSMNEISTLKLLLRGINRSPTANFDLAYAVRQSLTNSPSFTNAALVGNIQPGDDSNTFTFEMTVDLRHHFKL